MDNLVKIARNHASRPDGYYMEDWAKMADRIEALEKAYAQQQLVWSDAIARADQYEAALTPSSDTKAAYHGEFSFLITVRVEDEETSEPIDVKRKVMVPWNTIKEIMAAIRARAALGEKKDD